MKALWILYAIISVVLAIESLTGCSKSQDKTKDGWVQTDLGVLNGSVLERWHKVDDHVNTLDLRGMQLYTRTNFLWPINKDSTCDASIELDGFEYFGVLTIYDANHCAYLPTNCHDYHSPDCVDVTPGKPIECQYEIHDKTMKVCGMMFFRES